MIYKDICTKKTYKVDGQEKTIWLNIGTLRKTDEGKEFIELNMFPNTPIYVFDKKVKQSEVENQPETSQSLETTTYTDDDGEVKEIPF